MKRIIAISASLAIIATACSKKEKEYDATGTFEATEVTVSAKATGELQTFHVVEGQTLLQGDLAGNIDVTQLRLKKEELATAARQMQANQQQLSANRRATDSKKTDLEKQVAVIKQQIANAKRERQRFTELVNDGAVARKQLDDINYQISVLEKQLTATADQLSATNKSLAQQSAGIDAQISGIDAQKEGISVQSAQLDDQIANASIKSPITGTVLEKYVEQGEFVTAGKPLFKIGDTKNMFIRAYVTSQQLQNIKVGQTVKVFADYGNGKKKEYDGTVAWISNRSEFTPKTILTDDERADLVYAVKISFVNDGFVKIGMYGEVKF
ncbi:MAG: HlyD family efflux transporter periplasmic adaptor subunit [Muribaculaceae bacterium]|nr:HlyD family efflux transporter periplasmic adaptor subunit [Muribaculaceae bacterium]